MPFGATGVDAKFLDAIRLSLEVRGAELDAFLKGNPELSTAEDGFGNSLIDSVAFDAPINILDILVLNGCDPNHLDSEGLCALHMLAKNRNSDVQKLKWYCLKADPNRVSGLGWLPLHFAAEKGGGEVARVIARNGGEVDARTRFDSRGRTPLMISAQSNNYEVFAVLLECGADDKIKDKFGRPVDSYIRPLRGWRFERLLRIRRGY